MWRGGMRAPVVYSLNSANQNSNGMNLRWPFSMDYDFVATVPISATQHQYRSSAANEHQPASQSRKPCINLALFFPFLPISSWTHSVHSRNK